MLCCFETPWQAGPQRGQTYDSADSYPGQRRFVKTRGNALAAAPSGGFPNQRAEMVAVTVPHGVVPGQAIQVSAPDGSGRVVSAVVPEGCGPGSNFMVNFPPASVPVAAAPVTAAPVASAPMASSPTAMAQPVPATVVPAQEGGTPTATVVEAEEKNSFSQALDSSSEPASMHAPIVTASPAPSPAANVPPVAPPGQKLLRVQVPPGTAPGTMLTVQVPGENRTIGAQVPAGVSEFHVAYEPQVRSAPANATPSGQKLLLVRVPPGTAPGTTLHVQVPGEPGRVLAAQVPPGNVSEFHVAYQPRNGMNQGQARGGAYGNNNNQRFNNNQGYNNQGYNNQGYNNRGYDQNQNNSGGGLGSTLLPLVGGAAVGAATMAMIDHYSGNGGSADAYGGDAYADDGYADDGYAGDGYAGDGYADDGGGGYEDYGDAGDAGGDFDFGADY